MPSSESVATKADRWAAGSWHRAGPAKPFPGFPPDLPPDWVSFADADGDTWFRMTAGEPPAEYSGVDLRPAVVEGWAVGDKKVTLPSESPPPAA